MDYIACGGTINLDVLLPTYASPDGTTEDTQEQLVVTVEEDWGWSRNLAACKNGAGGGLTDLSAFPKPINISILQDRTADFLRNDTLNIVDNLLSNLALPAATTSGLLCLKDL